MFFNVLKENLKDVKYDDQLFSHLSLDLADLILSAVKDFGYQRYKLIVKTLFIQKTGQAINVSTSLSVRTTRSIFCSDWVSLTQPCDGSRACQAPGCLGMKE